MPIQDAGPDSDPDWFNTAHSIVFSPQYATDKKIFLSGWNLDVSMSVDGGNSFTSLWDANGVHKFGSHARLSISPHFGKDGNEEILAQIRADEHIDYKEPLAEEDRAGVRQACKTGAELFLSKDSGKTWKQVSEYLPFMDVHYTGDAIISSFGQCSLSIRAHQEDEEEGLPVAQLMIKKPDSNGDFKKEDGFELIDKSGINVGPKKARLGAEAIAVHESGRIVAAWEDGGVTSGMLDTKAKVLASRQDTDAPGSEFAGSKVWFQQVLPGPCSIRGKQSLLVNNKQGHLVGASGFGVVVSKDGGKTFHEVFAVPQTVSKSNNMIPGCSMQRNSEDRYATAYSLNTNNDLYTDAGLYCLKCQDDHHRLVNGTCGEGKNPAPMNVYQREKAINLKAGAKLAKMPARFAVNLAATGGEASAAPAASGSIRFSPVSFAMLAVGAFAGFVAGAVLHRRSKRLSYEAV